MNKRAEFHEKLQRMLMNNMEEKITFSFKEIDGVQHYCFEKAGETALLSVEDDPAGIYIIFSPKYLTPKKTVLN